MPTEEVATSCHAGKRRGNTSYTAKGWLLPPKAGASPFVKEMLQHPLRVDCTKLVEFVQSILGFVILPLLRTLLFETLNPTQNASGHGFGSDRDESGHPYRDRLSTMRFWCLVTTQALV